MNAVEFVENATEGDRLFDGALEKRKGWKLVAVVPAYAEDDSPRVSGYYLFFTKG